MAIGTRRGTSPGGLRVPWVGCDAQAVLNDSALEVHGEESVVAALQDSGGHLGPCLQRPWLREGSGGLGRLSPGHGSGRHIWWNVVKEGVQYIRVVVERAAVASGLLGTRRTAAGVC